MRTAFSVTLVQARPRPIGAPFEGFAADAARVLAEHPGTELLAYPEMHLFGIDDITDPAEADARMVAAAQDLDGPLDAALRALAADLGVWLVPGTVCERGEAGAVHNTAVVYSPTGERVGSYRKLFPWRPYEVFTPGAGFTVVELPGIGRLGLTVCYDAWFPEVTRQVAWLGAEVVLNLVRTTTPDRAQELVLARANAITNQVFMLSLNCAGPVGYGESLVADPEGAVVAHLSGNDEGVLALELDLDHVTRVHREGTAGTNRLWSQCLPGDQPIALPLYGGSIDPRTWTPVTVLSEEEQ